QGRRERARHRDIEAPSPTDRQAEGGRRPWRLRGDFDRPLPRHGGVTPPAGSVHRRNPHEYPRIDGGEQLVAAEEVVQEAAHDPELAPVLFERCTLGSELGRRELALAP